MKVAAFILCGFGLLITLLNFYTSFVRYPLHRLFSRGKSFIHSSGVPLVGSALLWVGALMLVSTGSSRLAWGACLLSLLDTGGIHWFFLSLGLAGLFQRNLS